MNFQDLHEAASSSPSLPRNASQSPSQDVASAIFQINTAVATFRRSVQAVGTSKDTPDHRQKLHGTRQRILQLVKETSAKLKSLGESDRSSNISKVEITKLAKDFQTSLQEFQKVQQLSSERESTYSPSDPPSSSLPSRSGYEEDQENQQPFLQEQKRNEIQLLGNEVSFNEAIIEEREQGIRDVEEQIGEVNEIFTDLAVLVHEQGVVIDDIHSNIDNSSATTTQAKEQLSKGSKSVKSKSKWCWWVLGIVVVVVVVLVVVLIA